ncbi:MAG TPA: hypothetical protein VE287_08355 [Actinopolymorphaceae bacterium]|nr:hypothetical protein [Actinopolymorphaceae bacterium]
MPPSQAAALVREVDAARQHNASHLDLVGCWVSAGWSDGLTVEGHSDWPDEEALQYQGRGLAQVLVAREDRNGGKVSACGYLVDVYCLGVKNAVPPRRLSRPALLAFKQAFFGAYEDPHLEAPLELAQHLVYGAVEYARGLGFEPHPDFHAAANHLGTWTGPSAITFGREGKPFFIQGPHDDAIAITRTLERTVGNDFEVMLQI